MKRDRDNLRKLIREKGFADIEDYLMQFARPSIRVKTDQAKDENDIPLGASKVGGRPDLPTNTNWVTVRGYKGESVSLPFIAQLDMAAAKPYDEEDLLPREGLLYFFGDYWIPTEHSNRMRVIFYNGDRSVLERKAFPDDIPHTPPDEWGTRYDPCMVTFIPEINLPIEDENLPERINDAKSEEDFYDLVYLANYPDPNSRSYDTPNRLLGANSGVTDDLQLDCQLIADTGEPYNATEEERKAAQEHKNDWQLLLQMSSDDNAGMMWSDVGILCFYIRRSDLLNLNFENICLTHFSA